jgi:hypothetical protein
MRLHRCSLLEKGAFRQHEFGPVYDWLRGIVTWVFVSQIGALNDRASPK